MKFQNNNQEVIKRLTKRQLKSNKIRNLFAIAAVVLTTFMIASLFCIGLSFAENYKMMQLRMQGSTATTALNNPSKEQIEGIKKLGIFNSSGYEINIGQVADSRLAADKIKINLKYYSDEYWQDMIMPCISDVDGEYPKLADEIMISRKALEFMGMKKAKIGDKIQLSYQINDQIKNEEFTLSGIYTNYSYSGDTGEILTAKALVDKNNLTLIHNGTLYMKVQDKYKYSCDEILKENIKLNDKQEFEYTYDIEDSSQKSMMNLVIIIVIIVLFLMISGYLFIYNIMYISVTKDINFYGLLKTIGTSPKQIKKIVKGQILSLSLIGIPAGLILAAFVSFIIVPLVMNNLFAGAEALAMPNNISFNPIIFIGAALFSLATVIISVRKPAQIASRISPTEALKYTGSSEIKKKNRRSTNGGKLYKMAWYNVFRDKKRAIVVFISLFMGIITFLSVNTFIESISLENYLNSNFRCDFRIEDREAKNTLSNKDINKLKDMAGIESIDVTKTANMKVDLSSNVMEEAVRLSLKFSGYKDNELEDALKETKNKYNTAYIVGLTDRAIEEFNKNAVEPIDIDEFKNGRIAIYENTGKHVSEEMAECLDKLNGTSLRLNSADGKKSNEFLMKEAKDDPAEVLNGGGLPCMSWSPIIYVSNSMLEKLNDDTCNYLIQINCDSKYEGAINNKLESMCSRKGLDFESKSARIEAFKNMILTEHVLGGGTALILLLIGLLNFINVMITGINSRLKEFAIMESIGMTKKQLKKMLTLEGLYYASITTMFIITIGMAVIYGISQLAKGVADYAEFVFPSGSLAILVGAIFIICLITPAVVYKSVSKETITQRLRKIEN